MTILAALFGAALLARPSGAAAATLDFESAGGDSSSCSDTAYTFPRVDQDYGGFTWSTDGSGSVTWVLECDADYTGPLGNTYGSPSGDWAVGNDVSFTGQGGTDPLSLTRLTPFIWNGAQFTSFSGLGNGALLLTVQAYLAGVLQYSIDVPLPGDAYAAAFGQNLAIDELRFIAGTENSLWLMDDFSFDEVQGSAVPEPASLLLVGTGLAFVARRRRRA